MVDRKSTHAGIPFIRKRPARKPSLQDRWLALCHGLRVDPSVAAECWQDLVRCYSEPGREYHTLRHIAHCFGEYDLVWHLAKNPRLLALAIFFHDKRYVPGRIDNELLSADDLSYWFNRMGLPSEWSLDGRELVFATCHLIPPVRCDAKLMADIDLAGFAQPYHRFRNDSWRVWQEYRSSVPDPSAFNNGRADILESFLKRQPLYHSEFFRTRYESRAKMNLERSIEELRRSGAEIG